MTALRHATCKGTVQVMGDGSYYCPACDLAVTAVFGDNSEAPAPEPAEKSSPSASTGGLGGDDDQIQPVRAEDFINEADDTEEGWVLEGRIPTGSMTLLVSPPKTGKSRFARQLCRAMESGGDFCGQKVTQGRCLYLALEERPSDVRKHLRLLGAKETLVLARPLRLTPENLLRLSVWIGRFEIKMIVVDTLNRAWFVESASDRRQTDVALTPLLDMAHTTGCTVLILHHTRKAAAVDFGSDVAESNDIVAAADQVCYLRRTGKRHPNRRLLQAPGLGRYPPVEDIALEFNDDGIFLGLGDAQEVEKREEQAIILNCLSDWQTKKEVAEATELSEATVRRRIRELEKDGLIETTGRGVKNNPQQYRKKLSSSHPNSRGERNDDHFSGDTDSSHVTAVTAPEGTGEGAA